MNRSDTGQHTPRAWRRFGALPMCLLTLMLLLSGCPEIVVKPRSHAKTARSGEPFTLRQGETARLADARLDITFAAVLADDRCPPSRVCSESGPVRVAISAQYADYSVASTLQLSVLTDPAGNVVHEPANTLLPADRYGSMLIGLLNVSPAAPYTVTLLATALPATPLPATVAPPLDNVPTETPPMLGRPFTIPFGQTAALAEIGLKITFQEVVRDSRCPADVACAWSGIVDVRIKAVMPPQPAQQLLLGGATNNRGVVLGPIVEASGPDAVAYAGYRISLEQVTPYPAHANRPDPPEAYAITLIVTLAPVRDGTPAPGVTPTPALPIDPAGLPLLCVSERVLTERTAGVNNDSPARLTPPIAARTLVDEETATAICQAQFGGDFHALDTLDALTTWQAFLSAGVAFWRWDSENRRPVAATT